MAEGMLGKNQDCTDCPLCEAPGCFRRALTRSLEPGAMNYLPTNWRGFADYFSLGVAASSPEELVSHWADLHPNRKHHTIRRVFEYAEEKQHQLLLQEFDKIMTGHIIREHNCTGNPAECFRTCSKCCCIVPKGKLTAAPQPNLNQPEELRCTEEPSSRPDRQSVTYNGPVTNTYVYHYSDSPRTFPLEASDNHTSNTNPCSSTAYIIHDEVRGSLPPALSSANTPTRCESPVVQQRRESCPVSSANTPTRCESPVVHQRRESCPVSSTSTPCNSQLLRLRCHAHDNNGFQEKEESSTQPSEIQEPSTNHIAAATKPKDEDVLRDFGNSLFEVMPYSLFMRYYNHRVKETVTVIFVIFFLYQGLAAVLMTMCENGGFHTVFRNQDNRYNELVHRLLMFALRMLVRVIMPLCCTVQLPTIASKPLIPATGFTRKEALQKTLKVHNCFTSQEELMEVRDNLPAMFRLTEEMIKRRIKTMWISLLHPALFIILLLYLGPFFVCEANTMKGGVCNFLSSTIVTLPIVNVNFHFIVLFESFSILIILLLIGVTMDCYAYENRIATFAIIIGGKLGAEVYNQIRTRWAVMDRYCCLMPLVLFTITLFSISTGRTFTPKPIYALEAADLTNWYFWVYVLTILVLLGTSSNRMAKCACLCSYLASIVFIYTVRVETVHIPFGTIMVLLFTTLSAMVFNLLYSLCQCHYNHLHQTKQLVSCGFFVFCVVGMCILFLSLVITVYREVIHFARFVIW